MSGRARGWRPSRGRGKLLSVDLTAMIDVVFQLIIFFMLTSRFGQMERTQIDLPREAGEQQPPERAPDLVVDVRLDGTYIVGSVPAPLADVVASARRQQELLAEQGVSPRVLIRADRSADAAALNRLVRALAAAGVRQVALGTRRPAGG